MTRIHNLRRGHMRSKIRKQVNRLRIFAFIKRYMEERGECPTSLEVAESLGMSQQLVSNHMRALIGADGLPLQIPSGHTRQVAALLARNESLDKFGSIMTARVTRGLVNPMAPVPVDVLIGAPR